jgi:hypothetical protein
MTEKYIAQAWRFEAGFAVPLSRARRASLASASEPKKGSADVRMDARASGSTTWGLRCLDHVSLRERPLAPGRDLLIARTVFEGPFPLGRARPGRLRSQLAREHFG